MLSQGALSFFDAPIEADMYWIEADVGRSEKKPDAHICDQEHLTMMVSVCFLSKTNIHHFVMPMRNRDLPNLLSDLVHLRILLHPFPIHLNLQNYLR
jgi:hypothetical protein